MKNVSSLKSSAKNESPKTPGGISKALLTPCRRVGLSRNWKKKGPSPFISPLSANTPTSVELKVEKKETRKRKSIVEEKANENEDPEDEVSDVPTSGADDIVKTPVRNIELPRKKSKTFLASLNIQESNNEVKSISIDDCTENVTPEAEIENDISIANSNSEETENSKDFPPPESRKATLKSNKFRTPVKSKDNTNTTTTDTSTTDDKIKTVVESINELDKEVAKPKKKKSESKTPKTKSPNQLTKECIVVIQKKLLKVKEKYSNDKIKVSDMVKESSQPLFDSDSDDVPLSTINKKENAPVEKPITISDDDEFVITESKTKKKESKKNVNTTANSKAVKTQKPPEPKTTLEPKLVPSSLDDDDDFFDKKKTIIIRKTYDKVVKPQKAKSTGSITQRDIDNLKSRIEVKKKMLLAKATTEDTEELRGLIKRWQKGCQEALVELMDLMKIKCPDKHNMDYSEILQMLKIPPSLVGYDSDHDCFNTPDDSSAVLSKFNDF
ncbi:uncharacterized protein [Choristoneura fumiferana]|uniref:uncharacterized protein n=1 Tax=Choristoneura fumiferana TaxID=7141 RepID=UPI003D15689E